MREYVRLSYHGFQSVDHIFQQHRRTHDTEKASPSMREKWRIASQSRPSVDTTSLHWQVTAAIFSPTCPDLDASQAEISPMSYKPFRMLDALQSGTQLHLTYHYDSPSCKCDDGRSESGSYQPDSWPQFVASRAPGARQHVRRTAHWDVHWLDVRHTHVLNPIAPLIHLSGNSVGLRINAIATTARIMKTGGYSRSW